MTDTPVERFVNALYRKCGEEAKPSKKGRVARCPAHDDRHPSLSIAQADDGPVLMRCHGGCSAEAICKALGLRLADLMPDDALDADRNRSRPRKPGIVSAAVPGNADQRMFPAARAAIAHLEKQHGKPSCMWVYHNAKREGVGVVCRWDRPDGSKAIRPVACDGEGWVIGGMREPRPLYGLPELADAKRVYVCEGEKAADAVGSIGLVATTSPHGSNSAGKADWTPLAGKDVVILPDNDQAGWQYADAVVAIVSKLTPAPIVKLVDLPGLPEAGDIVDWIDGHGDAAEPDELRRQLEALTHAAEPIQPKRPGPRAEGFRGFPVDALPEPIRSFVAAGAKAIGCDPCYISLPLFSALASAIGATRRIELKPGWTEPSVIWTATVGESGTLKSPAMSLALDALQRLQAWRLEEYPQLLEQHHRNMMMYEADLANWKKKGRSAGEPLPERPDEPAAQRYQVNDVTIEALAERLQYAPRGLLAANDELAAWLSSFDRYRSGRGGDVAKWLSIHRAESLLVDRKTGPMKTIFIKRAAVSVTGSIPPHTLSRALGTQHIENRLAARLLLALPPRHGKRWTEATVDPQLTRQVEVLFGRLLALDFGADANDTPAPIDLPLTPDGKAAWVQFYDEHAREQETLTGPLAAAYSKIEGYAARLALVVHLIRWASDDAALGDPEAIDGLSIGVGATLARWFAHEARRVYAVLGETDEGRDRRELAELVQRKGGSVTPRDLMRSSRQYRTAGEAENALDGLVKAGYGNWREDDHGGGRGRPTRRFVLAGAADVDTNSAKPEENGICVNVNAGDGAENARPANDAWADAGAED